jgi:hypothetical protein
MAGSTKSKEPKQKRYKRERDLENLYGAIRKVRELRERLMERSDGDYLTANRFGDCGSAATNDL